METYAIHKNADLKPRQARLTLDLVRGKSVEAARGILVNTNTKASRMILKVLNSAASNAVSAFGSGLSGLVDEAWAEFNDVLQAIYDFGAQAISAAQGIGQQIVQAIWNRHIE